MMQITIFNSYLKSQGIKRILNNLKSWWEARHPYRKWYGSYDPSTKDLNPFGKIGNVASTNNNIWKTDDNQTIS